MSLGSRSWANNGQKLGLIAGCERPAAGQATKRVALPQLQLLVGPLDDVVDRLELGDGVDTVGHVDELIHPGVVGLGYPPDGRAGVAAPFADIREARATQHLSRTRRPRKGELARIRGLCDKRRNTIAMRREATMANGLMAGKKGLIMGVLNKNSIAWCIANTYRSRDEPPMSLRSSEVVAGSTMSAKRAVAVHQISLTTIVSGRCQAERSRSNC